MRQYCFEQLAFVYETIGQTEDALQAQKMYSSIKDSLIHEKRTEELAKMETRFKTAEKEKENLVLKQQKQEQKLVVSRQRNWIFGIGGAALVMLFLGLFILQRNKRITKARQDALIIEERERGLLHSKGLPSIDLEATDEVSHCGLSDVRLPSPADQLQQHPFAECIAGGLHLSDPQALHQR